MKRLASVIRILLVIIAVLFCIFEIFKTPITIFVFCQSYKWVYNIDNFDEYHKDLLTVADFCRNFFETREYDTKERCYITYKRGYKDRKCSLIYDTEEIPLSDEVQKAPNMKKQIYY